MKRWRITPSRSGAWCQLCQLSVSRHGFDTTITGRGAMCVLSFAARGQIRFDSNGNEPPGVHRTAVCWPQISRSGSVG